MMGTRPAAQRIIPLYHCRLPFSRISCQSQYPAKALRAIPTAIMEISHHISVTASAPPYPFRHVTHGFTATMVTIKAHAAATPNPMATTNISMRLPPNAFVPRSLFLVRGKSGFDVHGYD